MIRTLRIENYRCLRDVTIELEPLTLFVGANASGKSSVLAALSAAERNDFPAREWRARGKFLPRIVVDDGHGVVRERGPGVAPLGGFPSCQLLQLDLSQVRKANTANLERRLKADGHGLSNVFATLSRDEQELIAQSFCSLVPMFSDVHVRPQSAGQLWTVFRDRWRDQWYEPGEVSDGPMLLLAYLVVAHQSPPPDVIAIEEPERGLHPYLMDQLVRVLRKLSKGEVGTRPVQILLATHSAELLEFVRPEEVRFFSRPKENGETRVEVAPVTDPSWQKTLRAYDESLGDIWLSGGLGGVPSS